MKIYDDVKLNTEIADLAKRGIHKGETGIILEIKADNCFVLFLNSKNYGDYACCNVNKRYLDICKYSYGKNIEDFEKFKATRDLTKCEFKINPFNEFDWVEILVEKEEYAKKGLHKGMFANVAFNDAIDNMVGVIFPGDDGYDREVEVHLNDIKLCD